jgi:outer membrane protein OmpA-like peptidoglycan-associated protein
MIKFQNQNYLKKSNLVLFNSVKNILPFGINPIINLLIFGVIFTLFINSCASTKRPSGFELQQNEILESLDTTPKPIYITGTAKIDTANPNLLIYDLFRLNYKKYPDTIKLHTRVYDSLGNFITNMAPPYRTNNIEYFNKLDESLGLVYKKRDVNIPKFTVREFGALDSIPFNIALLSDYSGSMDATKGVIAEGAEIFVKLKYPLDNIGVFGFHSKLVTLSPFSTDSNFILSKVRANIKESVGLFSAMADGVWNTLTQLSTLDTNVQRVMVVLSDGDDNYSKKKLNEIIERAKAQNVTIFTVAFGYSIDENLKYLAKYTGGKFYKAKSKEEMLDIFRDIYMSLRYYYQITYTAPKYWGLHTVTTNVEVPNRKADLPKLMATGEYDTSDLFPWTDLSAAFTRPILFDFNKDSVKEESFYILDEITDAMMSKPTIRIEIQGHTDNVGPDYANAILSKKRAESVMNAPIERGIEPKRLRARGFGMNQPIASNETEEGRSKNRRTVFMIIAK